MKGLRRILSLGLLCTLCTGCGQRNSHDSETPKGRARIAVETHMLLDDEWWRSGRLLTSVEIQSSFKAKQTFYRSSLAPGTEIDYILEPAGTPDSQKPFQKRKLMVRVTSSGGDTTTELFDWNLYRPNAWHVHYLNGNDFAPQRSNIAHQYADIIYELFRTTRRSPTKAEIVSHSHYVRITEHGDPSEWSWKIDVRARTIEVTDKRDSKTYVYGLTGPIVTGYSVKIVYVGPAK